MIALKALGMSTTHAWHKGEGSYLDEPRKMQPKMTTRTTVRMRALSGISCFEWTFAKKRLAGSPPSLQFHQSMSDSAAVDIPGESISHTTACSHDTYGGEEEADEREPGSAISASILVLPSKCGASHKEADRPSSTSSGIVKDG